MSILLVPCRQRKTRIMYYIYGVMGGFYRSTIAGLAARRVWWTLNTVGVLYSTVIGMTGYLLTTTRIHVADLLYTTAVVMGVFYVTVIIPLVTYYNHNRLAAIIRHVDNEFDCPQPRLRRTDIARARTDGVAKAFNWLAVMTALIVVFCASNFAYLAVYCDDSCLRKPLLYIQPTPFVERVRSILVYAPVTVVQGFFLVLGGTHASCVMVFGLLSGYELQNVFANLGVRLAHLIEDTVTARQSAGVSRDGGDTVGSAQFDEFKVEMAEIVKRYQKLSGAVQSLRPWIELMSSINLLSIFLMQTPFAYIVLVSEGELLITIKGTIGFVTVTLVFYVSCLLGRVFEDTNEKMINDVYSTAWYALPPAYRKIVHIFHGQVQQPIRFFAILIYPVTMVTFVRSVNFVYTVINLLRRRAAKS